MRKLILLLLITVISPAIYAQARSPLTDYKVYPGTITMNDGSIVSGYILNRAGAANQEQISFYTDHNDRKTRKIFRPSDLQAYTIENDQYKSVAYSGTLKLGKADKHFVFVSTPGAITTFQYWGPESQIFWQKGNEEPVLSSGMLVAFKKNISKLVGDYPELMAKIEAKAKGYSMLTVDRIIEEYNAWAEAKK